MKKLSAWILSLALALTGLPAFAESGMVLRPVGNLAGPDTVLVTKHMITVTQEWLAANGATLADLENLGDAGLKTETAEQPLPAELLESGEARVLSVSPDGVTVLLEYQGVPLLLKNGRVSMVSMDLTRCGYSEQTGYNEAVHFIRSMVLHNVGPGKAGFVWTQDGRYAILSNTYVVFSHMVDKYGLMWLDTENAEIYMAEPGGKIGIGAASGGVSSFVMQVGSDSAGGNMYCTVQGEKDGERAVILRRYPAGSAEYEELAGIPGTMCCEGMGIDGDEKLVFTVWDYRDNFLVSCSPEDGTYTAERLPEGLKPSLLTVTPVCTALKAALQGTSPYMAVLFRTGDGFSRLVLDEGAGNARLEPVSADTRLESEGIGITQAALSADGKRMLVCGIGAEDGFRIYLVDTESLVLTPVDASAVENADGPMFGSDGKFMPGLCFTGGDRYVLAGFQNGSTILCELVSE